MSPLSYHRSRIQLRLTSADMNGALQQFASQQITLYEVTYIDSIHLEFSVSVKDFSSLQVITRKRGETLEILHGQSVGQLINSLIRRPFLLLGMMVIIFLTCWLPTRVFFLRVEGNSSVPTMRIIECAQRCGIQFGASRRQVRSEVMKNKLLSSMPELQWAGITTTGCTAVITVRERNVLAESSNAPEFNNIVSLRDAVVGSIVVQKGTSLCQPGQAVKEGQILVSPYEDCGICIRATGAQAEIYGQTQHQITAISPTEYTQRGEISSITQKYSLIIGKFRINFYKGSGISGGSCAKIYEEKYITLPGGFVLPIALACEQTISYQSTHYQAPSAEANLSAFVQQYLAEQMKAGKILDHEEVFFHGENFCRLDGVYNCHEVIGIARPEEHRKAYE